jgi:hypothetical protein
MDAGSAGRAVAPSPQEHVTRGTGAVTSSAGPSRPQTPPASPIAAPTETRLALVIGNGRYAEAPLQNPLNDARAMEHSLRDVGFAVVKRENLTKRAMEDEIRAFGKRLRGGGVGLFYFAGHGVQVNGANYLLPIGSTIEKEQDVVYEAVDVGRVIGEMEAAENRLNIVILDACRNNPLTRSFRSAVHGLASMHAPSGTLIAYATAPGKVANDGDGLHGLYTQELLQQMPLPGVKLEDLFKRVRVAVKTKSQGKQLPWETSALEGDFFFVKPSPSGPAARQEQHVVAGDQPAAAVVPTAAAEQQAAAPEAGAPDRHQVAAPPQDHTEPVNDRVNTANRHPQDKTGALEPATPLVSTPESAPGGGGRESRPPGEAVTRPQESEPQQKPSGQRTHSRKRAKQQEPSASASQKHTGRAGWKIITK